jgi:hypothetical protein
MEERQIQVLLIVGSVALVLHAARCGLGRLGAAARLAHPLLIMLLVASTCWQRLQGASLRMASRMELEAPLTAMHKVWVCTGRWDGLEPGASGE